MNTPIRSQWRGSGRSRRHGIGRWLGRLSILPTAMLAIMIGALGLLALQETGFGTLVGSVAPAEGGPVSSGSIQRSFAPCGSSHRVTCVVDGDTFWLDGVKYRIADINTPEVSSPQCSGEAALGRIATQRLTQLLNAGAFTLAPADRDEDRYGRKLRLVLRHGQSLGMALVSEGLAHEWDGARHGWC